MRELMCRAEEIGDDMMRFSVWLCANDIGSTTRAQRRHAHCHAIRFLLIGGSSPDGSGEYIWSAMRGVLMQWMGGRVKGRVNGDRGVGGDEQAYECAAPPRPDKMCIIFAYVNVLANSQGWEGG